MATCSFKQKARIFYHFDSTPASELSSFGGLSGGGGAVLPPAMPIPLRHIVRRFKTRMQVCIKIYLYALEYNLRLKPISPLCFVALHPLHVSVSLF